MEAINEKLLNFLRENPIREVFDPFSDVSREGKVRCMCGKKFLDPEEMSVIRSKVRLSRNVVASCESQNTCCRECREQFTDWCMIVCTGCKKLVGYIPPGREAATGFVRRKGQIFHALGCPFCDEEIAQRSRDGKTEVQLMEKVFYEQQYGRKIQA